METKSKNTAVRFEPSFFARIEKWVDKYNRTYGQNWTVSYFIYQATKEKLDYEEPIKK